MFPPERLSGASSGSSWGPWCWGTDPPLWSLMSWSSRRSLSSGSELDGGGVDWRQGCLWADPWWAWKIKRENGQQDKLKKKKENKNSTVGCSLWTLIALSGNLKASDLSCYHFKIRFIKCRDQVNNMITFKLRAQVVDKRKRELECWVVNRGDGQERPRLTRSICHNLNAA
jgi:hypothetical protein